MLFHSQITQPESIGLRVPPSWTYKSFQVTSKDIFRVFKLNANWENDLKDYLSKEFIGGILVRRLALVDAVFCPSSVLTIEMGVCVLVISPFAFQDLFHPAIISIKRSTSINVYHLWSRCVHSQESLTVT